jgi:hypothetical protein
MLPRSWPKTREDDSFLQEMYSGGNDRQILVWEPPAPPKVTPLFWQYSVHLSSSEVEDNESVASSKGLKSMYGSDRL